MNQDRQKESACDSPVPAIAQEAMAGSGLQVALRRHRREVLRHVVELFLGARRQNHQLPLVVGEHGVALIMPRRKLAAVLEPPLLDLRRDLASHGSRRWSPSLVGRRRGRARQPDATRGHRVGELEAVEVEAVRRRPR